MNITICPHCGSSKNTKILELKNKLLCLDCHKVFDEVTGPLPLKIFISYGHQPADSVDTALKIREELISNGYDKNNVWIDQERLKGGCHWSEKIEDALNQVADATFVEGGETKKAGRFILLLNQHSVRRPKGVCLDELQFAIDKGIPIIPVMIEACSFPLLLSRVQYLDFRAAIPWKLHESSFGQNIECLIRTLVAPETIYNEVQHRLIHLLEPIDFETDMLCHLNGFQGREWVITAVQRWLDDPLKPRLLWIQGNPGTGKTALASWLANKKLDCIGAVHFCSKTTSISISVEGINYSMKGDPRNLFKSLAYQLAYSYPGMDILINTIQNLETVVKRDADTIFDTLFRSVIAKYPSAKDVVLLIDAIDEVTFNDRNDVVSALSKHVMSMPPWFRIIVTSRYQQLIEDGFAAMLKEQSREVQIIRLGEVADKADIRNYVEKRLYPAFGKGASIDSAISAIVEKSQNVLLYAHQVVEDILCGEIDIAKPSEFPKGLIAVYDRYFSQKFSDTEYFERVIQPFLGILFTSKVPITKRQIRHCLRCAKRIELTNVDINRIELTLSGLFVVDLNGYIRPFHKSLQDWFVTRTGRLSFVSEEDARMVWIDAAASIRETLNVNNFESITNEDLFILKQVLHHLSLMDAEKEWAIRKIEKLLGDSLYLLMFFDEIKYEFIHAYDKYDIDSEIRNSLSRHFRDLFQNGSQISERSRSYHKFGVILFALKRFSQSVEVLEKALEMEEKSTLLYASICNDLAESIRCVFSSSQKDTYQYYQTSYRLRKRMLELYHPDTLESFNNSGHSFYDRGLAKRALKIYKCAHMWRIRCFGAEHPKVAESLNNIAMAFSAIKNFNEAYNSIVACTTMMEAINPYHEELLTFYRNRIAITESLFEMQISELKKQGVNEDTLKVERVKWEQEKENTRKKLEQLTLHLYGDEENYVLVRLKNWNDRIEASGDMIQGKMISEAIKMLQEYITFADKCNKRNTVHYSLALHNLGVAYSFTEDAENALVCLEAAFDLRLNLYGHFHEYVQRTMNIIIQLLTKDSVLKAKSSKLVSRLADHLKILSEKNNVTRTIPEELNELCSRAKAYKILNRDSEAEVCFERAISLMPTIEEYLKGGSESLKFDIAVGYNEIAFHYFSTKKNWAFAKVYFAKAFETVFTLNTVADTEKSNMRLNLLNASFHCGDTVDVDEVRACKTTLEGDPRSRKADVLLAALG